ncbi:MAG TPA: nitroreductase family protein [Thermoanaerobaculia bacterium]|nr:nitroreductase family protein [Thermoanaerobaculia bacterium]
MRPTPVFAPLRFERLSFEEQRRRSREFTSRITTRRTVRDFCDEPVPFELVRQAILAAASAPSGANRQPWRFVVVCDPETKRRIRVAAEAEEKESYERRMPTEWLEALAPLGTDWHKPFLETAPYLIAVFRMDWEPTARSGQVDDGTVVKRKNYYASESVGIACGFLLAALHWSGLATLTHTPSPMGFLNGILGRPAHEKPYLLIPVGYPAKNASVPVIEKKPLGEVMVVVGAATD